MEIEDVDSHVISSDEKTDNFNSDDIHAASHVTQHRLNPRLANLNDAGPFRVYIFTLVESKEFHLFMLGIILTNTLTIGMQTMPEIYYILGWYLTLLDLFFTSVYIIECTLMLYALRLAFFKDNWNNFDLFIVLASILEFLGPLLLTYFAVETSQVTRVIRLFKSVKAVRVLRVVRTIKFLRNLQVTVNAIIESLPALGSIVMLISLVLYIFAIIGKGLYANVDPVRFGTIGKASFTLFQLITLDDWFFMYTEVVEKNPSYWHILLYLVFFIVLENFIFINLFIAVIVDNLDRAHSLSKEEEGLGESPSMESVCSEELKKHEESSIKEELPEIPVSGNIEHYYGRLDPAAANELFHVAQFTEHLLTLEYILHRNSLHHRNLARLLHIGQKTPLH